MQFAAPEAQPKNIDRPRVKRAFHRQSSREPGRIEEEQLAGQGTAPRPVIGLRVRSQPRQNLSDSVQKIPKLVQRTRFGDQRSGRRRPLSGVASRSSILPVFPRFHR
jgi:hypothetical protein